jgi:hypothetical protein
MTSQGQVHRIPMTFFNTNNAGEKQLKIQLTETYLGLVNGNNNYVRRRMRGIQQGATHNDVPSALVGLRSAREHAACTLGNFAWLWQLEAGKDSNFYSIGIVRYLINKLIVYSNNNNPRDSSYRGYKQIFKYK